MIFNNLYKLLDHYNVPRWGDIFIVDHQINTFEHLVVAPFIYTLYYKHTIFLGLTTVLQTSLYLNSAKTFEKCNGEIVVA